MVVVGWILIATLAVGAILLVYRTLRLGWAALRFFATRGVLAATAAFLSYLALIALLGRRIFEGESFLSLSLTLAIPLVFGGLAELAAHSITDRWKR